MKIPLRSLFLFALLLFASPVHSAPVSGQAIRAIEEEIPILMRNANTAGRTYGRMNERQKSSPFGRFILILGIGCAGIATWKFLKSLAVAMSRPSGTPTKSPSPTGSPPLPPSGTPQSMAPSQRQGSPLPPPNHPSDPTS